MWVLGLRPKSRRSGRWRVELGRGRPAGRGGRFPSIGAGHALQRSQRGTDMIIFYLYIHTPTRGLFRSLTGAGEVTWGSTQEV